MPPSFPHHPAVGTCVVSGEHPERAHRSQTSSRAGDSEQYRREGCSPLTTSSHTRDGERRGWEGCSPLTTSNGWGTGGLTGARGARGADGGARRARVSETVD